MTTMRIRPQWLPTAQALDAAIKASGRNHSEIAHALGVSANTISNRAHARVGVNETAARAMADVLGCDWEPLVTLDHRRKTRGRPKGGKNKPRLPGPASKALAMHEAVTLQAATSPPPINGRPHPVLGFELYSDGTSHVALKTTLPADRGAALLRQLLDFGLVQT